MPVNKRGVGSLAKSGGTKLKGDVTLSEGTGVTITPSGNDLQIAATGGGTGDVVGPASATDGAVAVYDGTTGKLIKNTPITYDSSTYTLALANQVGPDSANISFAGAANFGSVASNSTMTVGGKYVYRADGTDVPVADGGTGASTHTSGNYLKGNGTGAIQSESAATLAATIGALLFPVGSYYMNETNSTNPGTLLGFGTWTQITDQMIMAVGSTYGASTTGGSASHSHPLSNNGQAKIDVSASRIHIEAVTTASYTETIRRGGLTADTASTRTSGAGLTGDTDSTTNLPPYRTAYVWRRTA